MSVIVSNQRIRLALDVTQWFSSPTDIITSASPIIANNSDLQFELAFSYGSLTSDSQLASMTNWASVQLTLKDFNDIDGAGYWSKTLSNTDLNNGLTFAQWQAGTSQHCVIPITNSQNSIAFSGQSNNYWLVVEIITGYPVSTTTATFSTGANSITVSSATGISIGQNVTGSSIAIGTQVTSISGTTIGISIATTGNSSGNYNFQLPATQFPAMAFPVTVKDTGVGSTPPVFVTPAQYFTQAQSDARYALTVNLNAKVSKAGDTMTGALILSSSQMSGASGVYATTKAYVDTGDAAVAAASVPNTGVSTIAGAKTFSALLTASSGLTTAGTVTFGSLSGVLKATAGVIAGSATTSDLPQGSNLYFTNAQAIAATLTGYTATNGTVSATDTILQAIQKLGYASTHSFSGATVFPVSSQAAMLALSSAVKGDLAFRSDITTVYILESGLYSSLGSWTQWNYPVTSVNGATGIVSLSTLNVPEVTNLYFTSIRANAAIVSFIGVAGGICPLDSTIFVPWTNLPPLTGYVSGAGTISATDTILSAIQKLNGNIAAVNPLTAVLTGYTSGAGTISSADSILSAIQKLNGNTAALGSIYAALAGASFTGAITTSSTVKFSGTTNPGLVVNQLSTGQIGSLATTSGNYGNIVYDTTTNQLKSLVNGAFIVISSGSSLPLAAGSGNPLTGTLYFQDGLATFLHLGNVWAQRASSANANYDFQYSGSTMLTFDASDQWITGTWSYNSTVANGYLLNGNRALYRGGSGNAIDFGGSFTIVSNSSFATLDFATPSGTAFTIHADATVSFGAIVKMNSNKVIDTSNYYYDSSGNQILAGQQSHFSTPSLSGTYASDYSNLSTWMSQIQAVLQAHGLMHS